MKKKETKEVVVVVVVVVMVWFVVGVWRGVGGGCGLLHARSHGRGETFGVCAYDDARNALCLSRSLSHTDVYYVRAPV